MKIFLAFDFDYEKDYESWKKIAPHIKVPVTLFLTGHVHPEEPIEVTDNIQIGNHSFWHEEWYEKSLQDRVLDLEKNHEFLKEKYGITPNVYRSPHLRRFQDTSNEMQLRKYKPEMECAECSVCTPMEFSHLKQYFSSFHHFNFTHCPLSFTENFEKICKKGEDFTFFLDPHDFDERIDQVEKLISIGKKYGEFEKL